MAITSNPTIQNGALLTAQSQKTFLNITTTTLVKATAGRIARVNFLVAGGDATGAIYDCATTSGIATSNQVAVIPGAVGSYEFDFPCANGIVVVPGTGNTVTISYI